MGEGWQPLEGAQHAAGRDKEGGQGQTGTWRPSLGWAFRQASALQLPQRRGGGPCPHSLPLAPGKPSGGPGRLRGGRAGMLPAWGHHRPVPGPDHVCPASVYWTPQSLCSGPSGRAGTQAVLSRCLMSKHIQVNSSRAEAKLFT